MTRRAGFTLIEVLLAVTLTAAAAGMAGLALTTVRRTGEVVATHRATAEHDARLRALLRDMLRHAPPAVLVDGPLVQLDGAADAVRLMFLSRGVVAPFGTGPVWRVQVQLVGDSLVLEAAPVRRAANADTDTGTATAPLMRTAMAGVSRFEVEALEPATAFERPRWRRDWPVTQARPAALRLQWFRGDALAVPLLVSLDPLQGVGP